MSDELIQSVFWWLAILTVIVGITMCHREDSRHTETMERIKRDCPTVEGQKL